MRSQEVEVPITPMLDMAFQLLTFFILTYKPTPAEGQFSMNLLPAQAVAKLDEKPKENTTPSLDIALKTLRTVLKAGEGGTLSEIILEDQAIQGMDELKKKLEEFVNEPNLSFDQTLIKVDPHLKYSELMRVIDVYSSLKPKPLTKISFSELDPNEGGGPP